MSVEKELEQIRKNQEAHNKADDVRFTDIQKEIKIIKENHLVHIKAGIEKVDSRCDLMGNDLSWVKKNLEQNSFVRKSDFIPVKKKLTILILYKLYCLGLLAKKKQVTLSITF